MVASVTGPVAHIWSSERKRLSALATVRGVRSRGSRTWRLGGLLECPSRRRVTPMLHSVTIWAPLDGSTLHVGLGDQLPQPRESLLVEGGPVWQAARRVPAGADGHASDRAPPTRPPSPVATRRGRRDSGRAVQPRPPGSLPTSPAASPGAFL